jgi:aldehyde:ferredoxin oxidoreductase
MAEPEIFGYHNRILRVNLSDGSIAEEHPGEDFFRTYLGGRNFIAHTLLREVPPDADPLGPDNRLVFAAGVVTGAPVSGGGRNSVGARSPLTGGYGDAEAGGFWGAELKRAGYDAIIVEGQSSRPVYLYIHGDQTEIRSAEHLWGRSTAEVQDAIRAELGDRGVRVAQIGPAGENLVRLACISNDLTHFYGRSGLGAVMGSKKLRAIAVRGTKQVPLANLEAIRSLTRWMADNDKRLNAGFRDTGTAGGVEYLSGSGGLPTHNFKQGHFDGAERISGTTMRDTILANRGSCWSCIVRCKRMVQHTQGPHILHPEYGGPEYESIAALGSCCGVDDLVAVAMANERCAVLGLDTIGTGMAIAFAMECYENGVLTKADTDGLDLRFGNADAMLAMVEAIAERRGLGGLLAEGTQRAAIAIGRGAERFVIAVKGQEFPMHEPRFKHGLGIGYAVSPTGADHMHNMHDDGLTRVSRSFRENLWPLGLRVPLPVNDLSEEKVRALYYISTWNHLYNSLGLCQFMPYSPNQVVDLVRDITGWNVSLWELMKASERGQQMARLFNLRCGFTRRDDRLPARIHEPFEDGPLAGVGVNADDFSRALELYYQMMGWDSEGRPTRGRLAELGLEWASS